MCINLNKKNIFIFLSALVLLFILITIGVLVDQKIKDNRVATAAKAHQAKIAAQTPEEKAAQKGEAYFTQSITTVGTSERIFLAYLQRKFDLDKTIGAAGPPMSLYEDPRTYPSEIHFLARIAYADRVVKIEPKYELDDGVKVTNIYSANCDHLTLPSTFWPAMQQNVSTGGYYLTHVALALTMLKDNGCSTPPLADSLRDQTTQGMISLIQDPKTTADMRYECVAFLYLIGRRDLVQPEWITQIVKEQQDDGSWSLTAEDSKSDLHASLLALWALLEYTRPNTPAEPLIRH